MNTLAIIAFSISVLAGLVSIHYFLVARIHTHYAKQFRRIANQGKDADQGKEPTARDSPHQRRHRNSREENMADE